ncbi:hypothetical protein NDU88_005394 [Pleurodeles waltl]|uniref:tRNA methyltransferase 10 homolog C n=1 Tax=Pleurodeles waltl TaxID=8319 RepID=A0AAV7MEH2_PLEWA|nr:hypothetical protein NDU88_005394 [Pleurodeles waltl]
MELDLDGGKTLAKSDPSDDDGEIQLEQKEDPLTNMRELVEMWSLAGKMVPENISEEQLRILMKLPTKSSRKTFLKHLSIKEGNKKSRKKKKEKLKEIRKEESEQAIEKEDETDIRNTYFLQFWHKNIDYQYNSKAAQAMIFGLPLLFDMSYSSYMLPRELENTVNQLMESEGLNKRSPDPFHIHFCNLQRDGSYHKELLKRYQGAWKILFLTSTDKSYIDIFPAHELVYLTADSPNVIKSFEHNKVYIIGSLVDKSQQSALSLANAKRLKLATLRLPLEKYLQWEIGAKNLTLDQMIPILLTLKDTGDWKKDLEFVPKRKHDGFVDPTKYQDKQTLLKRKKGYDFGTSSKKVTKSAVKDATLKTTQRKWWEEYDN